MTIKGAAFNRVYEGAQTEEPFVGMGATEMLYSDRHAYTVQKVINEKRVIVTRDKTELTDGTTMNVEQEYTYTETPLVVEEPKMTCCNPYAYLFKTGCTCKIKEEQGCCEGCEYYKKHRKTNGIELRKCKNGWKKVGTDTYFTLGIKEEWFDPYF